MKSETLYRLAAVALVLSGALLLVNCAATTQMQRDYQAANSAFSQNYDPNRIYTLAILPPTGAKSGSQENLNGLCDFAGITMLQTGHFVPVERGRIDAVLREQEFVASGLVDPDSAPKIGKLVGADAVMLINITYTKHDDFFSDSPDQRETELNVKILSSSTAEWLYSGRSKGTSFEGELEAWQQAFESAVAPIKNR